MRGLYGIGAQNLDKRAGSICLPGPRHFQTLVLDGGCRSAAVFVAVTATVVVQAKEDSLPCEFDPRASAVVERFEETASEALARSHAAEHGFVVLGLERAGTCGPAAVAIGSRAAAFDVGWWCRELRTLLRAGMTVVEAPETLAASEPTGPRARMQGGLLQALRQGQALSATMQQAPKDFPAVLVAVMASYPLQGVLAALEGVSVPTVELGSVEVVAAAARVRVEGSPTGTATIESRWGGATSLERGGGEARK